MRSRLCFTCIALGNISKEAPTRLKLFHDAGTLPVKVLNGRLAYSKLDKEPQDNGKGPCSLLFPSLKCLICSQNLVLVVEDITTYTAIQSATAGDLPVSHVLTCAYIMMHATQ